MAKSDDMDNLDALIDQAVDTFFVEAPKPEERLTPPEPVPAARPLPAPKPEAPKAEPPPSLDEVMETLFTKSYTEPKTPTWITSGDAETDRAIDLAVDTLFVEEPETPIPETAELDVKAATAKEEEDFLVDYQTLDALSKDQPPPAKATAVPQHEVDYNAAMVAEIGRHMHTLFKGVPEEKPTTDAVAADVPKRVTAPPAGHFPLRKLHEAILTLEWEISKRSVTALATEIQKVRAKFRENVTVDFAVLSMRVVLDYVVKRMSRAHPESIRFLLEVTDFLEKGLVASAQDPLAAFHRILTRYETFKSTVRNAERIPDRKPAIARELGIKDPEAFARMVRIQATTLSKAGESLAVRLKSARDPENLIRSFRFLVNRAVSRILENTLREEVRKVSGKKAKN